MSSIDDILAATKPREATARILLDQGLLAEQESLNEQLAAITTADSLERPAEAIELARRLDDLERRIDGEKVPFTFRAIGHRRWMDLLRDHPPTKEQKATNPYLDHDPETFPAAAVAASCVEPAMTAEQAGMLEDRLSLAQWSELWAACLTANVGGDQSPKSVAAGLILRRNGGSATTAANEESPAPSSSDGL